MQRVILYIFYIVLLSVSELSAQEVLVADRTGGCDTVEVNFSVTNARLLEEYASVRWDFGDGYTETNTLNPSHRYTEPGVYEVSCNFDERPSDEILDELIIVSQTPYADFKYFDTSLVDAELRYYFFPSYFKPIEGLELNYEWTFHDASVYTDSTVIYSYDAEGSYIVKMKVWDINACMDSCSKLVSVYKELQVPNVFSPNGDQINDHFIVSTTGHYVYRFRVFTRNGLQIYYTESPIISWNGLTSNSHEAPEGVYYYTIDSDETPVRTRRSGFIHLYR